jgi:hypothetical protein
MVTGCPAVTSLGMPVNARLPPWAAARVAKAERPNRTVLSSCMLIDVEVRIGREVVRRGKRI